MMGLRKRQITELFRISLLYHNPLMTAQFRQKYAHRYEKNPNLIYRDLLLRYNGISIIIMLLAYTVLFLPMNYDLAPYLFDLCLAVLVLFSFMQGFTTSYHLFYEGKDLPNYMALPLRMEEVFFSRLLMLALGLSVMVVPLVPLYGIFLWQTGREPVLAIGLAIAYDLITLIFLLGLNFVMLRLFSRLALLKRLRQSMMTTVNVIVQLGAVAFIIFLSQRSQKMTEAVLHLNTRPTGPISALLLRAYGPWLFLLLGVLLAALIGIWLWKGFAVRFYDMIYELQDVGGERKPVHRERKKSKSGSLRRQLWRYNLSCISDSTVISESVFNPLFMPIIMFIPLFGTLLSSGEAEKMAADSAYGLLIVGLGGLIFAVVGATMPSCLSALMVSLDGNNFNHIQTLPLSMATYLRHKWIFAASVTGGGGVICLTVGGFIVGLPRLIPVAAVVYLLTHFILSGYWMSFDLRHLNTGWHSVSELYHRIGKAYTTLRLFLTFILLSCFAVGMVVLARRIGAVPVAIAFYLSFIVVFLLAALVLQRQLKKYIG